MMVRNGALRERINRLELLLQHHHELPELDVLLRDDSPEIRVTIPEAAGPWDQRCAIVEYLATICGVPVPGEYWNRNDLHWYFIRSRGWDIVTFERR